MIVCLSGWKHSGKDECSKYLVENYGAIRVALADPLKDSVAREFGIDRMSLDDPKRKEMPILAMPVNPVDGYSRMIAEFMVKEFRTEDGQTPNGFHYMEGRFRGNVAYAGGGIVLQDLYWTPRALAILRGSTNRLVSSAFWTNQAFAVMADILKKDPDALITVTDVRYRSELVQFTERFGDQVAFVRINRFKESPSNDPSENDLNDHKFNLYIDNTGTLEQLHGQLKGLLSHDAE